jgi:hypothetical protein
MPATPSFADSTANSTVAQPDTETPTPKGLRIRTIQLVSFCVLLLAGAVEDWFARADYSMDAISYLSVLHAIQGGEWKTALNPMWNIGYPLALALVRPLFPSGASGEWEAIHAANLAIFAATFVAFLFMLREAVRFSTKSAGTTDSRSQSSILCFGIFVFSFTELCMDNVSRVGPDLSDSCLMFTAIGLMLMMFRKPEDGTIAPLLGATLGSAYLMKLACLPVAACILAIVAVRTWQGAVPKRRFFQSIAVLLVFVISFVVALSWANGSFTMGETGRMNYAIHVEHIPAWTHWQGGPPRFGDPVHPARKLLDDPGLYEFGEPFHTTYPPFNNMAYWYQGHRIFWNPLIQASAIARGIYFLSVALIHQPFFYVLLLSLFFLYRSRTQKVEWKAASRQYWPFFLPAVFGIVMYLLVHLEPRYIASFLAILALTPLLVLLHDVKFLSIRTLTAVVVLSGIAATINVVFVNRVAFANALRGTNYQDDVEWKVAAYLSQHGLTPGDKVAAINTWTFSGACTWAELDGLRIVAEIANDPFDNTHRDQSIALFWGSSAATQQKVYQTFRQAGAVAIVAPYKPDQWPAPGWQQIPKTSYWYYPLR